MTKRLDSIKSFASLRLRASETTHERFVAFCESIYTASRLGYDVGIHVLNDPYAEKRGEIVPLDVWIDLTPRPMRKPE